MTCPYAHNVLLYSIFELMSIIFQSRCICSLCMIVYIGSQYINVTNHLFSGTDWNNVVAMQTLWELFVKSIMKIGSQY